MTFRERLQVEQFIETVLIGMTAELSLSYADRSRVIANEIEVGLTLWRESSLWLCDVKFFEHDQNETNAEYFVASSKANENFDVVLAKKLNNHKFKSFDDYCAKRHGLFWTVNLNKDSWMNSKCDCLHFLKNYVCRHIVGIALKEKLVKLPKKALTVRIAKKATLGRKPKASSALRK